MELGKINNIDIGKKVLQFSGEFSLKKFYNHLWQVLRSNGYTVLEKSYTVEGRGAVKNLMIKWSCERLVNDFVLFKLNVDFQVFNYFKNDQTESGIIKTTISYSIQLDYKNKWSNNDFLSWLYKFYLKNFYGYNYTNKSLALSQPFGTFKEVLISLGGDVSTIVSEVKSFFNMR